MPIRAVLFDFGHTLVDFQRTEEALHEAYEQIRARIEAVAYMEVHELLDLVERVAGGVDRLVEASYVERRMEELDIAELFRESLAGIGFVLPDDVLQHIVVLDHSAYSNSMHVDDETLDTLRELRGARPAPGHRVEHDAARRSDAPGPGPPGDRAAGGRHHVLERDGGPEARSAHLPDGARARRRRRATETVFVGDRLLDDVVGARGAGMRTVLTHRFRQEEDPDIAPDALDPEPWGAARDPRRVERRDLAPARVVGVVVRGARSPVGSPSPRSPCRPRAVAGAATGSSAPGRSRARSPLPCEDPTPARRRSRRRGCRSGIRPNAAT